MAGNGSFDWNGAGSPLGTNAVPVVVALYDDAGGGFAPLPNVVCDGIDWRRGAEPPVARFRYLLDVLAAVQGFPTTIEELWPIDADGPDVVKVDDRIVVVAYTPQGKPRFLFDGHVQAPQADLDPGSVSVDFTAVGVAARCFDLPIGGRLQRGADDLENGAVVQTDLPTRFNPTDVEGRTLPNCTPANHDVGQGDGKTQYPVFVEERLEREPDPRREWDLSGVVRYVLGVHNDEEYVENPDFRVLHALLKVRKPKDDSGRYDPGDPATYKEDEVPVREFDATNKCWPDALETLLAYSGFGFSWTLDADAQGKPRNGLIVYRLDQASDAAPKVVWLDAQGSDVDPARNTVEQLHLVRDVNQVVNAFSVETAQRRVELSVVLAPGFTPAVGDETSANRPTFLKSKLDQADAETVRKYRFYVADDAGDGHYDAESSTWAADAPLDLDPIFPPRDDGEPRYVVRRRPGANQLVSVDADGQRRRAALYYSQNYKGKTAAVWDGTGDWTQIGGGWRLLDDRLGIVVTIEDPEQWYVGKQAGELRGVTWQANPPAGKRFALRLTTVVDDDYMLPAVVSKRIASPTQFERRRRVDARDVYRMESVHSSSPHYVDPGDGGLQTVRDDTDLALDQARLLQAAHETPPLAGSITLPFLTCVYAVGDRISAVAGRGVSLRSNVGGSQGEAAYYPTVVAVSWSFAGDRQSTTLQLSDRRAEPPRA